MNFAKFLRAPFLTEHLRWLLLENPTCKLGCSPVNFLHIFGTYFYKNTSDGLLLENALAENFGDYYINIVAKYCKLK